MKLLTFLGTLISVPAMATCTLNGTPTQSTNTLTTTPQAVTLSHTIPLGNAVIIFTSESSSLQLSTCTATSSTCTVLSGTTSCNATGTGGVGALSCAYILATGAALTAINLSVASGSSSAGIYIADWSCTNAVTFDTACNVGSLSGTTLTPCTLTLSGTNDIMMGGVNCEQTCSTATGTGWGNSVNINGNGTAVKSNSSSGSPPSFPMSPTGAGVGAMIALKEAVTIRKGIAVVY